VQAALLDAALELQVAAQVRMVDDKDVALVGLLWIQHHFHQPVGRLQLLRALAELVPAAFVEFALRFDFLPRAPRAIRTVTFQRHLRDAANLDEGIARQRIHRLHAA
jgi:hypothetical protein